MKTYSKNIYKVKVVTPLGTVHAESETEYSLGWDTEYMVNYYIPTGMSHITEIDEIISDYLNNMSVGSWEQEEVVISPDEWAGMQDG